MKILASITKTGIAKTLFPAPCLLCGAGADPGIGLCPACLAELPRIESACLVCGIPLVAGSGALVCGACLSRPPPFVRCIAPLAFEPPVRHLLHRFKYEADLAAARPLVHAMAAALREDAFRTQWPGLLLPVPLHAQRLRERGFNQSLRLAAPLARRFGLPLARNAARRLLATAPQSTLSREARQRNLKGAFVFPDGLPEHVALVDDVVTTTATVTALAAAARRAGAKRVEVWAAARAE